MKKNFKKNVFKLIGGAAFSQILLIITSPILTRLYSPGEFGVYTLFTSVIAILTIIATGKYELSIVGANDDVDANKLFKVTVNLITLVSAFILVIILALYLFGVQVVKDDIHIAILFPLGLFIMSFNSLLNYWLIRRGFFTLISISSIIQTITTVYLQLFFLRSYFSDGSFNLILALLLSHLLTVLFILFIERKEFQEFFQKYSFKELTAIARKYIEYPKYMVVANLFNRMTVYLPVFVITYFFPSSIIGFFGLAQRIIRMPMSIIGKSISDVYFKNASELYLINKLELEKQTKALVKKMFLLALFPVTVLFFLSERIFGLFFGQVWSSAGEYASILSIGILFQFVFSPLARIFQLYSKQKQYQKWEIIRFLIISIGMLASLGFKSSIITTFFYTIALSVSYMIMGWMVKEIFKNDKKIKADSFTE